MKIKNLFDLKGNKGIIIIDCHILTTKQHEEEIEPEKGKALVIATTKQPPAVMEYKLVR